VILIIIFGCLSRGSSCLHILRSCSVTAVVAIDKMQVDFLKSATQNICVSVVILTAFNTSADNEDIAAQMIMG